MTVLPIVVMGIVITIACYFLFLKVTENEVRRNLVNQAVNISNMLSNSYEGDYRVEKVGESTYHLYKGYTNLTENSFQIDRFANNSGVDFTVFYYDIRVITTIRDKNGKRITLTPANSIITEEVINKGNDFFRTDVDIYGEEYYAYYMPLRNPDSTIIGMIFAGKPTSQVRQESMQTLVYIPLITLIVTLFAAIFAGFNAKNIIKAIEAEKDFLGEVAKGNIRANLDANILKRNDELGDMGRFTISVQKFIRDMIERDTLTKLYTRRIGEFRIEQVQRQYEDKGVKYCVAMGDIDFFKKFNDTYGHDCGDLVLKETARVFNEMMIGHGFTVRWGGEEFLIIFDDADLDKANEHLKKIRENVINNVLEYKEQQLSITMTFGLTQGDSRHINDIIKEADSLLYMGKQNGRNQIVTSKDAEAFEVVENN